MDDNPAERKDIVSRLRKTRALLQELDELWDDLKGRLDGADFDEDDEI